MHFPVRVVEAVCRGDSCFNNTKNMRVSGNQGSCLQSEFLKPDFHPSLGSHCFHSGFPAPPCGETLTRPAGPFPFSHLIRSVVSNMTQRKNTGPVKALYRHDSALASTEQSLSFTFHSWPRKRRSSGRFWAFNAEWLSGLIVHGAPNQVYLVPTFYFGCCKNKTLLYLLLFLSPLNPVCSKPCKHLIIIKNSL